MENAVAVFTSVRSKTKCNTSFGPLEVAVCYDMFMETTYLVLGIQMVMAVFPRILLRFESSNKDFTSRIFSKVRRLPTRC